MQDLIIEPSLAEVVENVDYQEKFEPKWRFVEKQEDSTCSTHIDVMNPQQNSNISVLLLQTKAKFIPKFRICIELQIREESRWVKTSQLNLLKQTRVKQ